MILDNIIEAKREEVRRLKTKKYSLKKKLKRQKISLIAEIKQASPSRGTITEDFNPGSRLKKYRKGGADAVSILTDEQFFQGDKTILQSLRPVTELPLLRKDFIIDPLQVYESSFLGADVILLIAAVLTRQKTRQLLSLANRIGLEAIVEVHTVEELQKILPAGAQIIGINNRNLHDFSVDLKNTEILLSYLEKKNLRHNYYIISESGIKTRRDMEYLSALGVDGVLIGESLMKSGDPVTKIKELFAGL